MNFSIIKRTLGWILVFEAIFFLVPLIASVVYWEEEFFTFLFTILLCASVGGLCLLGKPKNKDIYAKEGFVIVALGWIVMSLFGALPFVLSGAIPSFVDALFETVSGFTTTGASILSGEEIDGMARSLILWRSFTHWVGGMGVLVLMMAFLPLSGARNMHIMNAESPGPTVSKLVPKMRQTALILYSIYFVMTLVQLIMLLCGGMPLFEALNTAFAVAGTGGFASSSSGMAGYNSYLQIVVTVFMLLFSINFNSYYLLLRGKVKDAFNAEVKTFLIIVAVAIGAITLNLCFTQIDSFSSVGEALKHAAFSVSSVISTTGFATVDFAQWPLFSRAILILLMFIGACAGSTGGGMKVSRWIVLGKGAGHEIKRMIHPKQVKKISVDGKVVEHEVVRSINSYLVAYIFIFVVSLFIISLDPVLTGDFESAFSSVATTLNNVGPGTGKIAGPMGNFGDYSIVSKIVFTLDMLIGRLEIFPMLILFAPSTWIK
ncbi:MAG: TrkH family potassium uptake protein [Clostridia bacterium]|nr:TrkH family potassium uptake protein [Clostridia bacterium]